MLIINNCSEIFSKANDLSLHLRLNAVINVNSVKCVELKINMLNQMFTVLL